MKFKPKKDVNSVLATISGRYLGEVKINDETYFTFNKDLPHKLIESNKKLPSDCKYRKDMIIYIGD